ncbi:MAG: hypothetical protein U0412_06445 [Nitrospira sp.]
MTRIANLMVFAALLTFGMSPALSFAAEPTPVEQKEKKDMSGSKADEDKKKDDKKDMGGK